MATLSISVRDLEKIIFRFRQIQGTFDVDNYGKDIAALISSQTRRRINREKSEPETGAKWPQWSEKYAKTRHRNQSLLISTGHLRDSIFSRKNSRDSISIGTNLFYAKFLQEGTQIMPKRPFLGLSRRNQAAIERHVSSQIKKALTDA